MFGTLINTIVKLFVKLLCYRENVFILLICSIELRFFYKLLKIKEIDYDIF